MIYKNFIEELQTKNISDNAEITGTLVVIDDENSNNNIYNIGKGDTYLYGSEFWL